MDDARIWIYAALIVFAFINWLKKRIKAVAEARRQRAHSQQYEKKIQEKKRQRLQQEKRRGTPSTPPSHAPSTPAAAEVKAPSSLKELFQQVAAEQARAQEALDRRATTASKPATTPKPPPLPVQNREKTFHQSEKAFHQREQGFHKKEDAFHQTHQAGTEHAAKLPTPPVQGKRRRTRKEKEASSATRTSLAISRAFSERGRLRNALILKEILDTPKGLL